MEEEEVQICIKKLIALAAEQRAEIEALTTFVIGMYSRLELDTPEISLEVVEKIRGVIDQSKEQFLEHRLIEMEDAFPAFAAELSQILDEANGFRTEMQRKKKEELGN